MRKAPLVLHDWHGAETKKQSSWYTMTETSDLKFEFVTFEFKENSHNDSLIVNKYI